MENLNLSLITAIAVIVICTFRQFSQRRRGLPPGNLGLPFIGETLQLISAYRKENPEPFVDERIKKFGNIFTTHVFGEATVFSVDPETNRFILMNEGKMFDSSYPGSISNLLGKGALLLMKGNLHKKMHSLVMSFGNSSIIRDHLLFDIDRLVGLNMKSWSDRILLMEEAKKITFEVTMYQLLSLDPCEWTESLRKEYVLVIDGFFTIPSSLFSPTYRRAIKARTKVAEALGWIVSQRRKENVEGEKKNDMLAALLSSEVELSDNQIVDFLLSLLVAGYETTSTTMTLAVKFLTETPSALAQLKEEHETIRSKNSCSDDTLEWSDYKSMPFTQCVINETLRVANIVGGIFRHTTEDIDIKGYTIPKGSRVFAAFRAIHLDEDNFKDARTFNPWRWQNNSEAAIPGNVFTPFGGGPRLCPGYELARVSISVFLHRMVTNFSWTPAEDDKLVFFPTTRTQKRYPIILKRRECSEAS